MHDPGIGGDNEFRIRHGGDRLDQRRGRADDIGQGNHLFRRFRVHQDRGLRMTRTHLGQRFGAEALMDDAGSRPVDHLGAGLFLNVLTEMAVGGPQHLFPRPGQMADDRKGDPRGHYPIGPGLDLGAGIGVDDNGVVGVLVTAGRKEIGGTTFVQRACRRQIRHQDPFFIVQNLRRFPHEPNAGNHQCRGRMLGAEPGHLQ